MFTNKHNQFWKGVQESIGGAYYERKYWKSPGVIKNYKSSLLTFDYYYFQTVVQSFSYEKYITRATARYTPLQVFSFSIYEPNFFQWLCISFHPKRNKIKINNKTYAYTTNNNDLFQLIFLDPQLLNLFGQLEKVNLRTSDHKGIWEKALPENEIELCYFRNGLIKDKESIILLNDLLEKVLDKFNQFRIIA